MLDARRLSGTAINQTETQNSPTGPTKPKLRAYAAPKAALAKAAGERRPQAMGPSSTTSGRFRWLARKPARALFSGRINQVGPSRASPTGGDDIRLPMFNGLSLSP